MSNGVAIEVLKGQAALAHLQNLKQKRGRAFAEAEGRLAARGFSKTETAVVVRGLSLAAYRATESPSALKVQSTITNSEGELVFWSWTDGDPSTWEGTIFMEAYGKYELLSDGQIDIASEVTAGVIWEDLISFRTERDGPIIIDPTSSPGSPRKADFLLVSNQPGALVGYSLVGTGSGPAQPPMDPLKWWFACTLAACMTTAAWCWITGAYFFACFNPLCASEALGCVILAYAKFIYDMP